MKFFNVTVKMGHVGNNCYFCGNIFISAENSKEATFKVRWTP